MEGTTTASNNKKKRNRKRRRSQPETPSFCDTTASLLASSFATSRFPEVQALYQQYVVVQSSTTTTTPRRQQDGSVKLPPLLMPLDGQAYQSRGCQTSARHLRRRTTSHVPNGRRRHRYPQGPGNTTTTNKNNPDHDDAIMTLKDLNTRPEEINDDSTPPSPRHSSRRSQRFHRSWLRSHHEQPWQNAESFFQFLLQGSNCDTASTTHTATPTIANTTGCFWIPTHLWHAKRFHMQRLWGWKVPLLHTNRGAQAALRFLRSTPENENGDDNDDDDEEEEASPTTATKCLIQDVSYRMQPIQCLLTVPSTTTSTTNNSLRNPLQRVIPNFGSLKHENDDGRHSEMGHGMFHAVDQAPGNAIGPVEWLVSQAPPLWLHHETPGTTVQPPPNNCCYYVYLFVHPSIVSTCVQCLQQLLAAASPRNDNDDLGKDGMARIESVNCVSGGVAAFVLRGAMAESCVRRAVVLSSLSHDSQRAMMRGTNTHLDPVECSNKSPPDPTTSSSSRSNGGGGSWTLQNGLTLLEHVNVGQRDKETIGILVSSNNNHPPRTNTTNDASFSFVGTVSSQAALTILCRPRFASQLWLSLVVQGGACPIGLAEEAQWCLECDPPRAMFPRDYPETEAGQQYWNTATTTCTQSFDEPLCNSDTRNQTATQEWSILRRYLEGGLGRIHKKNRPPMVPIPSWNVLIPSSVATTAVVMMRGIYGQPLLDLMKAARTTSPVVQDPSPTLTHPPGRQRRRRRPTLNPTDFRRVPPPSQRECQTFQQTCLSLRQSLSLPALVMVQVRIEQGKGTLIPGSRLIPYLTSAPSNTANHKDGHDNSHALESGSPESPMGFVTASVVSPSRGRGHGMAVVGAARFLDALRRAPTDQTLVQVCEFATSPHQSLDQRRLLAHVVIAGGKPTHAPLLVSIRPLL